MTETRVCCWPVVLDCTRLYTFNNTLLNTVLYNMSIVQYIQNDKQIIRTFAIMFFGFYLDFNLFYIYSILFLYFII